MDSQYIVGSPYERWLRDQTAKSKGLQQIFLDTSSPIPRYLYADDMADHAQPALFSIETHGTKYAFRDGSGDGGGEWAPIDRGGRAIGTSKLLERVFRTNQSTKMVDLPCGAQVIPFTRRSSKDMQGWWQSTPTDLPSLGVFGIFMATDEQVKNRILSRCQGMGLIVPTSNSDEQTSDQSKHISAPMFSARFEVRQGVYYTVSMCSLPGVGGDDGDRAAAIMWQRLLTQPLNVDKVMRARDVKAQLEEALAEGSSGVCTSLITPSDAAKVKANWKIFCDVFIISDGKEPEYRVFLDDAKDVMVAFIRLHRSRPPPAILKQILSSRTLDSLARDSLVAVVAYPISAPTAPR